MRNKEVALQLLKAKLVVIARQQSVSKLAEIRGDMVAADWGQQIRSYVQAPPVQVFGVCAGASSTGIRWCGSQYTTSAAGATHYCLIAFQRLTT